LAGIAAVPNVLGSHLLILPEIDDVAVSRGLSPLAGTLSMITGNRLLIETIDQSIAQAARLRCDLPLDILPTIGVRRPTSLSAGAQYFTNFSMLALLILECQWQNKVPVIGYNRMWSCYLSLPTGTGVRVRDTTIARSRREH
jgi:hypothetical protein